MKKVTPGRAIKAFCIQCMGGASEARQEVRNCAEDDCLFHQYRRGKGRPSVKIIRKMCLYCMGGNYRLISEGVSESCPIHYYRFGKNPKLAGRTPIWVKKRGLAEELAV